MKSAFSFNLVDEAWIPCLDSKGVPVDLSLRDVLTQAHQLQSIVGDSPPVTVALHRLLLAILHRVFGPENENVWADLWKAEQWDAQSIDVYLGRWRHRFDLFDEERPFYQVANLHMESNWVSVRRLAHHLGAINPLFEHSDGEDETAFSPAMAARAIVAAQGFSLCGTSGAFFPRKRTTDKKVQAMFVDAINARSINFILVGNSLFETLSLNLLQYPDQQVVTSFDDDAPVWETDNAAKIDRGPLTGYLDYLTWQNRRILLKAEADAVGNTVVKVMRWEPTNRLDMVLRDPMQHNVKNKKEGFSFLRFSEDKVLWRDSAALLSVHQTNSGDQINFPPATFRWVNYLKGPISDVETGLEAQRIFQCLALGMASKPGQANVYFYREERIPLPIGKSDIYVTIRILGMHWQVPRADELKWAGLSKGAKNSINSWIAHTGVERSYWSSLDIPFQSFIVDLAKDQEEAQKVWFAQLRTAAWDAFEQAAECVGNDGRSFKAMVRGRGYLAYRLKETLPNVEEEK
jgi:CRISPR system Cascade subunit CasA